MSPVTKRLSKLLPLLVLAVAFSACPSAKRLTIDGYSNDMLSGKRITLLLPESADISMNDAGAFAAARGLASESARERVTSELRTNLTYAISQRLDSNTVLNYKDQAVSASIPLNATSDFNGAEPKSWDNIKRVAREGNVDYILRLNHIAFNNAPSSSGGRGEEGVVLDYSLLDASRGKVMTSGQIDLSAKELAEPTVTYTRIADDLTGKLPFSFRPAQKK